jgi:hypothetical protein
MTEYVVVGQTQSGAVASSILALMRGHGPYDMSITGYCALPSLTATTKVGLEVALQLSVGLAMLVLYIGAALCHRALLRLGYKVKPRCSRCPCCSCRMWITWQCKPVPRDPAGAGQGGGYRGAGYVSSVGAGVGAGAGAGAHRARSVQRGSSALVAVVEGAPAERDVEERGSFAAGGNGGGGASGGDGGGGDGGGSDSGGAGAGAGAGARSSSLRGLDAAYVSRHSSSSRSSRSLNGSVGGMDDAGAQGPSPYQQRSSPGAGQRPMGAPTSIRAPSTLGPDALGTQQPLQKPARITRARLVTAAVNFLLTAYATLTVAAVKLLHCVWVPGTPPDTRHLFIRASVPCHYGGWQAPYVVAVVVLAVVALALPLVARWASGMPPLPPSLHWSEAGDTATPTLTTRLLPSTPAVGETLLMDVQSGVWRALVEPYSPKWYWWESVLLLQRLVRGVVGRGGLAC